MLLRVTQKKGETAEEEGDNEERGSQKEKKKMRAWLQREDGTGTQLWKCILGF